MFKKGKKLISKLLVLVMCTSLVPTTIAFAEEKDDTQETLTNVLQTTGAAVNINEETVTNSENATSVRLNKTSLSIAKGNTETLTATVLPSTASNKSVLWESSNIDVATVDENGKVTAIGAGTATITCTASDGSGQYVTCSVTVTVTESDPVEDGKPVVTVNTKNNGNSISQTYTITAEGGTVDSSKVKIIYSTENGLPSNAQNVWCDNAALQLDVAPWYTSLTNGVTGNIVDGKLTLGISDSTYLAEGTEKLSIDIRFAKTDWSTYEELGKDILSVYYDGVKVTDGSTEKVEETAVEVTSVTLNQTNLDMTVGQTGSVIATVLPSTASNKKVTWESSNIDAATVDAKGKITAVGAGIATITCTASDGSGKSAACAVTVIKADIKPVITVNTKNNGNSISQTYTITAEGGTIDLSKVKIIYSTENGLPSEAQNVYCDNAALQLNVSPWYTSLTNGVTGNIADGKLTLGISDSTYLAEGTEKLSIDIRFAKNDWSTYEELGKDILSVYYDGVQVQGKNTDEKKDDNTGTVQVASVALSQTSLDLITGQTGILTTTVLPSNATNKIVTWKSSDAAVATVDEDGKVTAIGAGSARITCTANDGSGKSAVCEVTVKNVIPEKIEVTSVALSQTSLDLKVGQAGTLTTTVLPDNATNKKVTWKSSNTAVATVDENGKVTAIGAGTATITCMASDGSGQSAICTATVAELVRVTSVALNQTSLNMIAGQTGTLTATVLPSNATNNSVTWKSSNTAVATVDENGKVTAIGAGTTTITCTANDGSGQSANCVVAVEVPINLTASKVTCVALTLTWSAFTDNARVKEYEIYNGETPIGSTTDTKFRITGLEPDTSYDFCVKAIDEAGNQLEKSSVLTIKTNIPSSLTVSSHLIIDEDNVYKDITINGGYLDLNGHKLMVNESLKQIKGTLFVNDGKLSIDGDCTIDGKSYIIMKNSLDYIGVGGNFLVKSEDLDFGDLTAGVLELKGNFTQASFTSNGASTRNFVTRANCTVILSGDKVQTVSCINPSKDNKIQPKFETLIIKNSKGIVFDTSLRMGTLNLTNTVEDSEYTINGDLTVEGGTIDLGGKTINISGDLVFFDGTIDLNNGKLNVSGSLTQSFGTLLVNGGQLTVAGDYKLSRRLEMKNSSDYISVGGNFDAENAYGDLTAGVLELKGNFTLDDEFKSSGNHIVRLSGTGIQTISIYDPNRTNINILEVNNPNGISVKKYINIKEPLINDLNINGDLNVKGKLDLGGKTLNVTGNLVLSYGTLDLNGGTLNVNGSFTQTGGTLFVNGGKLNVEGDYSITNKDNDFCAYLKMINNSDYVSVGGNFLMESSNDHSNLLTAGVLDVKGNFTQNGQYYIEGDPAPNNFVASGDHKVILSGSEVQTVSFERPDASCFNILEVNNPNGIVLKTRINIIKPLVNSWSINGDFTILETLDLGGNTINVNGNLVLPYKTIDLNGGKLNVNGNLTQIGGTLFANGGKLNITGDYTIDGACYLKMTNSSDYISVGGNFLMHSYCSHKDLLTAGVLEIKGNFTQKRYNVFEGYYLMNSTSDNFPAGGSHKVILSGTASFEDPKSSYFNMSGTNESSGDKSYFEFDASTGTITGYNATDTEVVIPSTINGTKVTGIRYHAFYNCSSITSITIPDSVTSIDANAFEGCNATFYVDSDRVKQLLIDSGVDESKIINSVVTYGVYKIGELMQPEWLEGVEYDEDFKYDPSASATVGDYKNWAIWEVKSFGADALSEWSAHLYDLSDGVAAYEHYRSAEGTDLTIDYEKAYENDEYIRNTVNKYIADAQEAAQELSKLSGEKSFKMIGGLVPVGRDNYPTTENWQKTIGAHFIWISADVTVDSDGQFKMIATVHEIDRYNFNKGMQDVATGTPDEINGRFAVLGWAKSFNTIGEKVMEVTWTKDNIENTTSIDGSGGRI